MGIFSGSSPFDLDVGKAIVYLRYLRNRTSNRIPHLVFFDCFILIEHFTHDSIPLTEKATDEKNMSENWETILDVCDKVKAITTGPKDCLRAIIKRLYHQNPHVAKQSVKVMFF